MLSRLQAVVDANTPAFLRRPSLPLAAQDEIRRPQLSQACLASSSLVDDLPVKLSTQQSPRTKSQVSLSNTLPLLQPSDDSMLCDDHLSMPISGAEQPDIDRRAFIYMSNQVCQQLVRDQYDLLTQKHQNSKPAQELLQWETELQKQQAEHRAARQHLEEEFKNLREQETRSKRMIKTSSDLVNGEKQRQRQYRSERNRCRERLCHQDQVLKSIQTTLQCGICTNLLSEPRVTACGDIFCLDCLTQWADYTENDARAYVLSCPTCRREYGVEDDEYDVQKYYSRVPVVADILAHLPKVESEPEPERMLY